MRYLKIILALTLIGLVISGVGWFGQSAQAQTDVATPEEPTAVVYTPTGDVPLAPAAITAFSDYTTQGTNWVAERPWKFFAFRAWGWGTQAKVRSTGNEWVHIPIPFPTYVDGTAMKISKVEFCAQSTAGARSKPVRMDLWANKTKFRQVSIGWPADNNYHCVSTAFSPPVWKESLGVSVWLKFANTADKITLYKAWVRVVP